MVCNHNFNPPLTAIPHNTPVMRTCSNCSMQLRTVVNGSPKGYDPKEARAQRQRQNQRRNANGSYFINRNFRIKRIVRSVLNIRSRSRNPYNKK